MKKANKQQVREAVLAYNKRVQEYLTKEIYDEAESAELDKMWLELAGPMIPLSEFRKDNNEL